MLVCFRAGGLQLQQENKKKVSLLKNVLIPPGSVGESYTFRIIKFLLRRATGLSVSCLASGF
ncbi:hypothetical protein C6Y45_02765 [Alkalicoccus saliphilus]|uniref:Uncharacterized protein n=1 Tax=Alkalicoccus saliphilus TaxID=200989 RepID=A0A2T4U948_9BACI|nr:hypothetical protein C6Y45_02765 [Alkalicoccus saliphilus]